MSEANQIEIKLVPERKMYHGNDFGVFACGSRSPDVEYNKYGNFIINGSMPELTIGTEYIAVLQEKIHPKYGKGYEVQTIRQELPTTIQSQRGFLESILSESVCSMIFGKYPNHDVVELFKNDTFDYKSIYGMGEATYTKSRDKVLENLDIQEVLSELAPYGISYTITKKLLKHYSNSSLMLIEKIKENPYILAEEVSGMGFKKVDMYALKAGIPKDSPHRIMSALHYYLKESENEGHCWMFKSDLIKTMTDSLQLQSEIISNTVHDKKPYSIYEDGERIALRRTYEQEKSIAEKLIKLQNAPNTFSVTDVDRRIKTIEKQQGFEFTEEQKQAIQDCIDNNVVIISGNAGSGKSSVLKGILGVLASYTYETCAFSGKASQRITEATGLSSKTMHRLLGFNPGQGFTFNATTPLNIHIIVPDEMSMVPTSLFEPLITAIRNGSKIIMLGDREQLEPIGAARPFIDMIDSGKIKVCELTKVHRQAAKSGILSTANKIREGQQIIDSDDYSNKTIGELKDLFLYPKQSSEDINYHIIELCKSNAKKFDVMEFQVITPLKKRGINSANNLNKQLQSIFNESEESGLKRGEFVFKTGDKIIKNGNDYENGVFNGTLGIIKNVDYKMETLSVMFNGNDSLIEYEKEQLIQIDLAYALTCHRVQGSQFNNVIFALDYSAFKLLSRQMVYTGLTRASKMCVFLFELNALRKAIKTNGIIKRNTFLREMLEAS